MNRLMNTGPEGRLIRKARGLACSLDDLIDKADALLLEAKNADEDMMNCYNFRDENLMKHLSEHNTDEVQMQLLRDNAELKATAEEFRSGTEHIMAKYREHCDGDMFIDTYHLREQYMAGLAGIVQHQNERIEQMAEVMKMIVDLEDRASDGNQQVIRQLSVENEQMRRQLQINCGDPLFRQGSLGSSESSTQFELSLSSDPDASGASSLDSLESFISCLSTTANGELDSDNSSGRSEVSQLEVSRLIDEALAESFTEPSSSQAE
ncbi:FGFR1 oncogene partner 2 homolog [Drosophila kikkawai]|uniref:FGFR1 oncogene partner 2 homolog n=1 Tax=Drosophila kikkawai TaxID=30033 RepID=A0A6P4IRN7_DROKI|nr:uncharacterized protein LOC108081125 [Drosophila kikkawai]